MSRSNQNNENNVVNKPRKKDKKNNVIILEFIVIIVLTIFLLFSTIKSGDESKREKLISTALTAQEKLSYYLGKMSSDTFSLYTNTDIILGKSETTNEEIKDTEENKILPLVDSDKKEEKHNKISYKINSENMNTVLKIEMAKIDGISWFIQDGTTIKVKLDSTPSWWTPDLDFLVIGND